MYSNEIHFLEQREKSDGYSISNVYRACNWETYSYNLKVESLHTTDGVMRQYVNTKVRGGWFSRTKHIMALDCDSYEDMKVATDYLVTNLIAHTIFESSPGRYWIITNCVGKFKDVFRIANIIPGVHSQYLEHSFNRKAFHLRAYPKLGNVPIHRGGWRSQEDENMIRMSIPRSNYCLYFKWKEHFRSYWMGSLISEVASCLQRRVSNGEIIPRNSSMHTLVTPARWSWDRARGDLYFSDGWNRVNAVDEEQQQRSVIVGSKEIKETNETKETKMVKEEVKPRLEINNCLDYMEI